MKPVQRPFEVAFHRPLRLAVTCTILAGAALATIAAILSVTHHAPGQLPAFAGVTVVLVADALLVWNGVRWAVFVTLAGLAGQILAVGGIVLELTRGIADIKVHQLNQIGFNPTAGVTINLIYSCIGFIVFGWFGVRWRRVRSGNRRRL